MDGILTLYDVSFQRTYTQESMNQSIVPFLFIIVTTDRKTTIQEVLDKYLLI